MTILAGDNGSDTLVGTADDDTISGGNGSDVIDGGDGDDILAGDNGKDSIAGGAGDDIIDGGNGNDELDGGTGTDTINGNSGNDTIHNGESQSFETDNIDGGDGNDTLIHDGGDALFVGSKGNDTFYTVADGSFFDLMRVSYETSTSAIFANLTATGGFTINDGFGTTDTVTGANQIIDSIYDDVFFFDAAYAATVNGRVQARLGQGDDSVTFTDVANGTISFNQAGGGVVADLASGTATDIIAGNNFIGNDTFIGASDLFGTGHDDELYGNDANNALRGSGGNDYIDGRGGVDELNFNDVLPTNGGVGVIVDLSQNLVSNDGFGFSDEVLNIERVRGTLLDDNITGDDGNNRLRGEELNDTLSGLGGDDLLIGDNGDTPGGLGGDDTLFGGAGFDTLQGGSGNDTLDGGLDSDLLNGGDGDDSFIFIAGEAEGDVIQDFQGADASGGDFLTFDFGSGGTINNVGDDFWEISGSLGTETIQIVGVTTLGTSDYLFV